MRIGKPVVLTAAAVLIGGVLSLAAPVGPAAAASCHRTGAISDINGDGIDDVAIAEPGNGHGRVHVLYGTTSGVSATSPDDTLITSTTATTDEYGETVAVGDFNDNGCADLAVADPFATVNGKVNAGTVTIFKGTPTGLVSTGVHLTASNGGTAPASGDYFGLGMATGDVNLDGNADLIVGIPNEDTVDVFLGTSSGLSTTAVAYREGTGGVPGAPAGSGFNAHGFGFAVATGDFNGDDHSDVAIGVPDETAGSAVDAGAVVILRGGTTTSPLSTTGAQIWSQNTAGVPGVAEEGDNFGQTLAVGDFAGNTRADLAIGVPGEGIGTQESAGAVNILYSGGSSGLSSAGAQVFDEDTAGVPGTAHADDFFGLTLSTGQYSQDNVHDLAVGVPGRTVDGHDFAGAVDVLYGATNGLSGAGSTQFTQATSGIAGTPEADDRFGAALTTIETLPHDGDELVVASPNDTVSSGGATGMITVIHRTGAKLAGTGSQIFTEGTPGVKGAGCAACEFGTGLG